MKLVLIVLSLVLSCMYQPMPVLAHCSKNKVYEMITVDEHRTTVLGVADDTAIIFLHGICADAGQMNLYADRLPGRWFSFNFPDAPREYLPFRRRTGLAQDLEIARAKNVLYVVGNLEGVTKIILVGVSRGASTIVNLLKQQDIPHLGKIVGVVLESPFAHVDDVIAAMVKRLKLSWLPGAHAFAHGVTKLAYTKYDRTRNQPCTELDAIEEDAKKIPVCIVCSQEDKLIPAASSERLGKAMQDAGFVSVEVHTMPKGRHAYILFDKDRESAQAAIQAIYGFIQRCIA